jgi:hypothetical protein
MPKWRVILRGWIQVLITLLSDPNLKPISQRDKTTDRFQARRSLHRRRVERDDPRGRHRR